jgi:hypothetical protein
LLRAYGGDPHAAERIHARAQSSSSEACNVAEQLANGNVEAWIDAELESDYPSSEASAPASALRFGTAMPWLAPFASGKLDTSLRQKWMATYHTFNHDFAATRDDVAALHLSADDDLEMALQVTLGEPLDPARGLVDPDKLWRVTFFPHLRLHSYYSESERRGRGDAELDKIPLSPKEEYVALKKLYAPEPPHCNHDQNMAYSAAKSGDGEPLTALIEYCLYFPQITPSSVLAVLPYVMEHRAELRDALRGFRLDHTNTILSDEHLSPFVLVNDARTQRDLMRVSGNADLAARWQEIVDRHAKVLSDRKRVIALAWL